jgi:hypothetical protein
MLVTTRIKNEEKKMSRFNYLGVLTLLVGLISVSSNADTCISLEEANACCPPGNNASLINGQMTCTPIRQWPGNPNGPGQYVPTQPVPIVPPPGAYGCSLGADGCQDCFALDGYEQPIAGSFSVDSELCGGCGECNGE